MSSTMCAFADAAEQSSNGWHTALGCPVTATSRPFDERSPNISGGKKDGGRMISQVASVISQALVMHFLAAERLSLAGVGW